MEWNLLFAHVLALLLLQTGLQAQCEYQGAEAQGQGRGTRRTANLPQDRAFQRMQGNPLGYCVGPTKTHFQANL